MSAELLAGYSSYTGIEHVLEEHHGASAAEPRSVSITIDPTNSISWTLTYSITV